MNIDFHHAATYVLSRCAGFDHEQANIIATSAQYVDDATHAGIVSFQSKEMYRYQESAHKNLDYQNLNALNNQKVWIPFHFLPGNTYDSSKKAPEFVQRITTKPNSVVAQEMMKDLLHNVNDRNFLHQVGVAIHVYADTWAHQNFVGINDKQNEANHVKVENINDDPEYLRSQYFRRKYTLSYLKFFKSDSKKPKLWDRILEKTIVPLGRAFLSKALGELLPLGHGAMLSYPDKPYIRFNYVNGYGEMITRNNPEEYLEASKMMYHWLRCFKLGTHAKDGEIHELNETDLDKIKELIVGLDKDDEHKRYHAWLKEIKEGSFSFGEQTLAPHKDSGSKSWVHKALHVNSESKINHTHGKTANGFKDSDWKMFRDAIEQHRSRVNNEILPKFGICVA